MPKKTESALQVTIDLSKLSETVSGMPIVTKIRQISRRAQSLMEDVNSEAMDLFSVSGYLYILGGSIGCWLIILLRCCFRLAADLSDLLYACVAEGL